METPEFLLKEAEKALSTSFFKRKPDYESAAMFYEKAAKKLQYSKSYKEAIDTFIKESDAHDKADSGFMSAKALENAGYVCLTNLKDAKEAANFYERSAKRYMMNSNFDRATDCYEKAGKALVESSNITESIIYFKQACELYEQEERYRQGLDTFTITIGFCVREKQIGEALLLSYKLIDILMKIQSLNLLYKSYLSTLIILLSSGDLVEASKQFERFCSQTSSFIGTDEGSIANDLLEAMDNRNAKLLETTIKRQQIGFLPIDIAKTARSLKVIGDEAATKETVDNNVTTSLVEDDFDEEKRKNNDETDDLC